MPTTALDPLNAGKIPFGSGARSFYGDDMLLFDSTAKILKLNAKVAWNQYGGLMVSLTNKTGANSTQGVIVSASTVTDNAVYLTPADGDMPIGVMYENGVADGQETWIVVSGIADVRFKAGVPITRGNVAYVSDSSGRAENSSSIPAAANHWREIGHVLKTETSGANVNAKCILHFN